MSEPQAKCARCGHAAGVHCKGQERHSDWRNGDGKPNRGYILCTGRHCLEPRCSCVELVNIEPSRHCAIDDVKAKEMSA
jgi:hypothetical protein